MKRILPVLLLLPLAIPAFAQEVKDGTYTNKKYGIKVSVPDKDKYTLKTSDFQNEWPNTVCEIAGEESGIAGVVCVSDSEMKAEDFAKWRIDSWKKVEGVENLKSIKSGKLEGKGDDAWSLEYSLKYGEASFHYLEAVVVNGKNDIELSVWCEEDKWKGNEAAIKKIVESLQVGEAKTGDKSGGGDKTGGGGGDKPKAASTVKVPEHMWKDFGVGTSVTYKMNTSGMEMETITTLLWKDDKSYVVRSDTVMSGNKMEGQPIEYVVEKATGSGDGGSGDKPKITEGDEEIEVPAGKFKCHWTQVEMEKPVKSVSKTWSSKDVPGGMVKMESEASGSKTTMALVKFEKK